MRNIVINGVKSQDEGLVVRTGPSGMNIRAMKYWLCAETGVECGDDRDNFKLVIAEPLEAEEATSNRKNQISIFLEENGGPGVQHIGLHTNDIVRSVGETKKSCNDVEYYVTPESYYESVGFNRIFQFIWILYGSNHWLSYK
jgi:hypothetical protein